MLLNAYATLRELPALDMPHTLRAQRDRSDPELGEHLRGFVGFLTQRGTRTMTQRLYHVIRHVERTQNHIAFETGEFPEGWALRANAVFFLQDGSVRDPAGRLLVGSDGSEDVSAVLPYPADAIARKKRHLDLLATTDVHIPETLPPVASEAEVLLRGSREVAERACCLLAVAVRAESLASGDPLSVTAIAERFPKTRDRFSPVERAFLHAETPDRQSIINHAWRYEALWVLEWALGLVPALPMPDQICDVPAVAKAIFDRGEDAILEAQLRPTGEILDALDLHLRLHWAIRQARLEGQATPINLDAGVVQERHHALNWLCRFQDAAWDDVDTPT